MGENLGLFGWPMPEPRAKAGRPEHVATDENRNKVMWLLVQGRTNKEIAAGIGVSQPTLRLHYFQLLQQRAVARLQLDATRGAQLVAKVLNGDVGAMKEMDRQLKRLDESLVAQNFGDVAPARVRRLGKKEQAELEAANAGEGSDWGNDLLPPGNRTN
jgi:DNA-binding transcriptional ArsR family regulator